MSVTIKKGGDQRGSAKETRTKSDPVHGEDYVHPAYGIARVTDVSVAPPTRLFGSNLRHSRVLRLEVRRASRHRNLHGDTHFEEDLIVSVSMSAHQWAQLMASKGSASGVPVTLEWVVDVGGVPEIDRESARAEFDSEVDTHFSELVDRVSRVRRKLAVMQEDPRVRKGDLADVASMVEKVAYGLESNMDFMRDRFREMMEDTVEAAKSEFATHVDRVIADHGLEHLRGMAPSLGHMGDRGGEDGCG